MHQLGVFTLSTFDILDQIVLCRGMSVHCRTLSHVPDLCPLDTSSTLPLVVKTKNVFRHCHMSPGGQTGLQLSTTETQNHYCLLKLGFYDILKVRILEKGKMHMASL